MMKRRNLKGTAVAAMVCGMMVFTGCGGGGTAGEAEEAAVQKSEEIMGTILLSVNPEMEISYDGEGKVKSIEGANEEGVAVAEAYKDYEGKACREVVGDLVEEIYEAGYFEQTVGGNTRNVVLKLEEGSRYPDDDFINEMADEVKVTAEHCGIGSSPMTVDEDDYREDGYITLEKAQEIVLAQLHLDAAEFTDKEYELDDGVYELEFTANGVEYEFEVNAVNGKVLEADYEHNDDWDDDDRDDDRDDDDRDDDRDDNDRDDDRDDDDRDDDRDDDDRDDDRDDD